MPRRMMLGGMVAGFGLAPLPKIALPRPLTDQVRAWGTFKERFLTGGRVVDTGNNGISHTEGQGIGLLSAVQADDRASFDKMLAWTGGTLARPFDSLHAWRYQPNAAVPVDDMNNATDGDLLILTALFDAALRWNDKRYHTAAMAMTRDIHRLLIRRTSHGVVLMPGVSGFVEQRSVTLNPSYYVFPALRRISVEYPDPVWDRLLGDGLSILRTARFGQWSLPPDWITVPEDGEIAVSDKWPARFSFDAVRVPLYLCWGGFAHDPVVGAVDTFWSKQDQKFVPAWADLRSGSMAPYAQSAGMVAIRDYVASARLGKAAHAEIPPVSDAEDYYAAALIMLVHNAKAATRRRIA